MRSAWRPHKEEALRQALIPTKPAKRPVGTANLSASSDAAREVELQLRVVYRLTYELLLGVDVAPKRRSGCDGTEPRASADAGRDQRVKGLDEVLGLRTGPGKSLTLSRPPLA